MQKYQNNIVSSSGTPVISASISVTNYPSGTAATIYSDNGVTLAANPLTSDSLGNFSFYAADGRYSLSISGVNVSATTLTDILLEDPTNPNPISATTITATGTSTLAGVTATSLAVSGAATVGAGLAVTGALSATGALTTNGLKEDSSGNLGIGGTPGTAIVLDITKANTGSASAATISARINPQTDVTGQVAGFQTFAITPAASFALAAMKHFNANQGTFGAGATVNNQFGYYADAGLISGVSNYGFYGNIPAGTNRYNFYANGTAPNRFVGETLVIGAAGLGYGTGAGGTVTQVTSKSTTVTLNKPTGQITMMPDAVSAGAIVQFNVTNSLVSVGDVVVIMLGSGTFTNYAYNLWANIQVGGGFTVSLRNIDTVSRSEAVVINFAIIKGATA